MNPSGKSTYPQSREVPIDSPKLSNQDDLSFAIPANRLRYVRETVEQDGEHFWRNGDSPQIIVFDESTPTNQEKYFPLLERRKPTCRARILMLHEGAISENSIVKIAQTFRSGANDIDAADSLEMFLEDEDQTILET